MNARKLVFYTHLVVGFAVGLLLTSAGLTGSVLVWRPELDALVHADLMRVQPAARHAPLDRVLGAAREAYPAVRFALVRMPAEPGAPAVVTAAGDDPLQVYVDPYRATVLGVRHRTDTFGGWLFEWHSKLLSGETGEWVMGTTGLLLLVLVATGVVVWWPGMRRLAEAVRVKWRAGWKRVNYDLHRAVGFWATAFLTMVAVTGSSLVFHDAYMAALNRLTASPPRPVAPQATPTGAAPLPLDSLIRLADAVVPGGRVTVVTLPAKPDAPVVVRKKVPEELHPNGRNFVYLHPETGAVLALEEALRAPVGTRAYNILYPIHIGRWGGILSRALYSLLGLTPAILFVSGLLMWWNRSGRRLLAGKRRPARPPRQRLRRTPVLSP